MRKIPKKWRILGAVLLAVGLVLGLIVPAAAVDNCDFHVRIPDAVDAAGGKVVYYPYSGGSTTWYDDDPVTKPMGSTIKWKLSVNGYDGPEHIKNVDCSDLVVTDSDYCNMLIKMDADLIAANAQITIYPWNYYGSDGDHRILPTGCSFKWRLKVNGFTGDEYIKKVDCTDLVAAKGQKQVTAYCEMEVLADEGVVIQFYPWNEKHVDGDFVIKPVSHTITWRIKGQSQTHQKHVDCTPLDARGGG